MKAIRFRPVAVVLLCLHLAGCTTWQPVQVSPREFIEVEAPGAVRVQDIKGDWKMLTKPSIQGDSILALETVRREGSRTASMLLRTALTDVTGMETRRVAVGRTIAATILFPPLIVVGLCALTDCISFDGVVLGPRVR